MEERSFRITSNRKERWGKEESFWAISNRKERWIEEESLWDALGLEEKLGREGKAERERKTEREGKAEQKRIAEEKGTIEEKQAYVLAFVGGGGKTSGIYRLAAEAVERGKRVIIMTTTHMLAPSKHAVFLEEGELDFEKVERELSKEGVVIVGDRVSEKKMAFIGEKIYGKLCEMAELILVEADGSRHLPIKVPASHEPVIPPKVDEIVCVCGLSCYGKKANEVCFRLECAKKIRDEYEECEESEESKGRDDSHFSGKEWIIWEKDIAFLMREGFLKPLREREKKAEISVMFTQADTKELEEIGRNLLETMHERGIVVKKLPLLSEYRKKIAKEITCH